MKKIKWSFHLGNEKNIPCKNQSNFNFEKKFSSSYLEPGNYNEVNSTVGLDKNDLSGTSNKCSKNYRKNEVLEESKVLNESFLLDVPSKIKRGSDKSLDE